MLENYLKIALRNITKNKTFSFINVILLAAYIMDKWLQNFAYKVSIGWWVSAVAAITALFIALSTVSYQAIKAAAANPVKSLKYE